MINLSIDGQKISVPEGISILEAAELNGIKIPTLCYLKKCGPAASCMVCVVRDVNTGKLLPSCTHTVSAEMEIETDSPEVRRSRKAALDLLLAEHVGDCEAPCRTACPAEMNIPLMIRQIAQGDMDAAVRTVKTHIPFAATLGRVCSAPCEKTCRINQADQAVAVCLLKRTVGDFALAQDEVWLPEKKVSSNKKVVIVGAGMAGLTAAYYLLAEGHHCVIYDRHEFPGGKLRHEADTSHLPTAVLDLEIDQIRRLGGEFRMNTEVDESLIAKLEEESDALILAIGHIDPKYVDHLGLRMTGQGIEIDRKNFQTSRPGVFAGGDAVTPLRMAVRSLADGRKIALSVNSFLACGVANVEKKRFNSRIGKLTAEELELVLEGASRDERCLQHVESGLTEIQAKAEALRCLHCECLKSDSCQLRDYADLYQAGAGRFKMKSRNVLILDKSHPEVVFEPGKCIKCGICIKIAEQHQECPGLSFQRRGFDMQVAVPFNESLAKALQYSADECIENCPTAALSRKINSNCNLSSHSHE